MSRFCVVLVLVAINSFVSAVTDVAQAFIESEIVPDSLNDPPTEYLTVEFPSGVQADLGNILTPTEVKDAPCVSWNASPDKYYVVMKIDPDAPTREVPTYRNLVHWLVGNVPGTDVAAGETIAEYIGAAPPLGSGLHRYGFLVFEQPGELFFDEPRISNMTTVGRTQFSVTNFVDKYDLGVPIAGNFYQAEYDLYVPILTEQLSGD